MNLNGNVTLSDLNPTKLLPYLNRVRGLVITVVIMSLIGFTGYQISRITNVQPNAAYITAKEGQNKTSSLHVNKTVITKLEQLQPAGNTTPPVTTGEQNPFSLGD